MKTIYRVKKNRQVVYFSSKAKAEKSFSYYNATIEWLSDTALVFSPNGLTGRIDKIKVL